MWTCHQIGQTDKKVEASINQLQLLPMSIFTCEAIMLLSNSRHQNILQQCEHKGVSSMTAYTFIYIAIYNKCDSVIIL